jgi:hypothetical protein
VGSLVHFKDATADVQNIPYYSLLDIEAKFYTAEVCPMCRSGIPVQKVWV